MKTPSRSIQIAPVERKLPEGRPRLAHVDQVAQAALLYQHRLFGDKTIATLSDEFGIPERTVRRRLALAREDGIPEEVREIFIQEMLPSAMAVVQQAMRSDDEKLRLSAAKMVIEGLDAMKLPTPPDGMRPGQAGSDDESMEVWRERIKIVKRSASACVIDALPAADAPVDEAADPAAPPPVPIPRWSPPDGADAPPAQDPPIPGISRDAPGLADGPADDRGSQGD